MCGIFGYLGSKEPHSLVLAGLKKLEYRGYDSWGIAVSGDKFSDRHIVVEKHIGKIGQVISSKSPSTKTSAISIGVGHTRWATHGGVTEANAHPHFSCKKDIIVVHNGIIENFDSLKKLLKKEGHRFESETDTEVIAHLVEKFYSGNLEKAVRFAIRNLVGTYGLLVVHKNEQAIIAAKNGSPLVLGVGKDEYFIASDVSPIIEHTKSVVYLDDGDILSLKPKGYKITDVKESAKNSIVEKVSWTIDQIEKKGYKHFMLKEITEQPESIMNTLRGRLPNGRIKLGGLNLTPDEIRSVKRIIIAACGTSWHAALVGEYLIEEYLRIPVEVEYASEFRYRKPVLMPDDLLIVISQSGETADTLAALQLAKKNSIRTLGIVNVVGSTIAREAGTGIYIHAGPEIGVASTKAFSCQIVALCLLTLYFGQVKGNIPEAKAHELASELKALPGKITQMLKDTSFIQKIARKYSDSNNFLYLGRGYEFPVALEGALKLKEISYVHAEGYPAAEMKHGPIALIDDKMPVVFLANKSLAYEKIISNMMEVQARHGRIIAVATKGDAHIAKIADDVLYVPKTIDPLMPILSVIPLQLLAYYIADLRGCDIDKPRNLAKSVTVE